MFKSESKLIIRPKKIFCVSGNPTLPIGTRRPYTFFTKMLFFFVGVFIIEASILNKKNINK